MSNLYETLEVSEKASDEVIEKAYKVLAKKFHPDLQPPEKRKVAEEKMKQINEAYETLSDKDKRAKYNEKLEKERQIRKIQEEQVIRKGQNLNVGSNVQVQYSRPSSNVNPNNTESNLNEKELRKRYVKAYNAEVRRIKLEMSLKKARDFVIAITIMIFIIWLLWVVPPTKKILTDLYENNFIVKGVVDIISNMIQSLKM